MSVKQVFNTSAELDYPTVLPTLDLDFANSKTLDPRITFTRASGGSYVGADGLIKYAGVNEARFDHDTVTGESLGLLVEEQRSNLLLRSEEFDNASWSKPGLHLFGSGSVANAIVAPDGLTSADLITENTDTSQRNVQQVSTTIGTKTLSVFAKQGPGSRLLRLVDFNPTNSVQGETYFNLSTGTVVSGSGSIQAFPNGWYRCSIQSTTTVTSTYFISLAPSVGNFTYTGDGTSGIYIWGAQLEVGSFPTSYIPTVASTRTRAADNASITGKNFSEWYRQDEGTFFTKSPTASALALWSTQRVLDVYGPRFQLATAGDFAMVNDALAVPFQIGLSPSYPKRIASAYKIGNYAQSNEGRLVTSTANTICTGQAVLQIGELVNNYLNGTIARLTYYPKRLPDAQLQALTR